MIQTIKTSNFTFLSSDKDKYYINERSGHHMRTLKFERTFNIYLVRDMIQTIKTSIVTFPPSDKDKYYINERSGHHMRTL